MSRAVRPLTLRRRHLALFVVLGIAAWGMWSYASGGMVATLLADPPGGASRMDAFREYVLAWGVLAPIVYVVAVAVEVIVAPFPGVFLYAPGGAIFGGFIGGTLSLIGNTAGSAIAAWLAATFGAEWVAKHADAGALGRIRDRLEDQGGWLVFMLRLNPLTSSDLVSYAAGMAGVPVRHVALGSLFGLAPQCYAQAYLAATIFEVVPLRWIALSVVLITIAVVVWLVRVSRADQGPPL